MIIDFNDLAPIEKVQVLENCIKERPQADFPVEHFLAGGIYARQMKAAKDSVFTGKIHLTEHLAMLVSGTMVISDGNIDNIYVGPFMFKSSPGDKRAGAAITDCIFTTFHFIGDKTDIDEIEKSLVVDTLEQYLEHEQRELLK